MVVCACALLLASLYNYSQIHIWQHDSAYYDLKGLFHKIFKEGRWLNPYIVSLAIKLDGRIMLAICLISLFGFFFASSYAYTRQASYAFLFSTLCLLSPSITDNLMWPAVTMPALAILFAAPLVLRILPVWFSYPLFGALFFSTLSNFYYLLPLTHLAILKTEERPKDLLAVAKQVILPWGFGFIFGFLVMKAAIFVFSYNAFGEGTTLINIADWREPNPVANLNDVLQNSLKSLSSLASHLALFFQAPWTWLIALVAISLNIISHRRWHSIAVALVGSSMVLAHYLIIIPIGINIELRTAIATWVGIYIILFLLGPFSYKIRLGLMFLMLGLITTAYVDVKSVLNERHKISSVYYSDLLDSIPPEYQRFKKIVVLSKPETYATLNAKIVNHYRLNRERLIWVDGLFGWSPMAYEAGFKDVVLCENKYETDHICDAAQKRYPLVDELPANQSITIVEGIYLGNLVIRLNPNVVLD